MSNRGIKSYLAFILLVGLCLPLLTLAAIGIDTFTGATVNPGSTLNWAHTVTSTASSNLLLVVNCMAQDNAGDMITAVSYNSVALTKLKYQAAAGTWGTSFWGLLNPSTGSNTVSVSSSLNTAIFCSSGSYTGVKQSGLPDASAGSSNTNHPLSQAVTTIADNAWLVGGEGGDDSLANCAGAGTTSRDVRSSQECLFDSNSAKTPPGSFSLEVTPNGSQNNTIVVVSIAPALAAGAGGPTTHLIRGHGRTRNNTGR